jgi:hypothetical protein
LLHTGDQPDGAHAVDLAMTARRLRRSSARLLAVVPLAGALVGALALPAAAAPAKLTPTGACVWNNGDGTTTAVFGWKNTGGAGSVAIGPNNQVYVGTSQANYTSAATQPQPTTFAANTTVASAFTVTFPSTEGAAWLLNGTYASLFSTSTACSTNPVDVINDGPLALIGFALLVPAGAYFLSRPSTRLGRGR